MERKIPSMTADWMDNIASALVAARTTGAPAALKPEVLARLDDEAGVRIQHLTLERLQARVAGWKVAVLPDDLVIAAPIIEQLLHHSPAALPKSVHGIGQVECEIAFLLGRSLQQSRGGVFGREEVAASIDSACAAVEVLHSRLPDGTHSARGALLADMLSNAALVVGAPLATWSNVDFKTIAVQLAVNGNAVVSRRGGLPSGDPLGGVVALANHLARRGIPLRAGQYVTTGSYTGVHSGAPGDEMVVSFAGFSDLRLKFDSPGT
jgi:2-keto-4-pentenoate hydratase